MGVNVGDEEKQASKTSSQEVKSVEKPRIGLETILAKRQPEAEHILRGRGVQNLEISAGAKAFSISEMEDLNRELKKKLERTEDNEVVLQKSILDVGGQSRVICFVARKEGESANVIVMDITKASEADPDATVNMPFFNDRSCFNTVFETFKHNDLLDDEMPAMPINKAIQHKIDVEFEFVGRTVKMCVMAYEGETLESALLRIPELEWKMTSRGRRLVGAFGVKENDVGFGWQVYLNELLPAMMLDGKLVFLGQANMYVNTSGAVKIKYEYAMIPDTEALSSLENRPGGALFSCSAEKLKKTGGLTPISFFIGLNAPDKHMLRVNVPKEKKFEVSSVFIPFAQDMWLAVRAKQMETMAPLKKARRMEIAIGSLGIPPGRTVREESSFNPQNKARDEFFITAPCIFDGILAQDGGQLSAAQPDAEKASKADKPGREEMATSSLPAVSTDNIAAPARMEYAVLSTKPAGAEAPGTVQRNIGTAPHVLSAKQHEQNRGMEVLVEAGKKEKSGKHAAAKEATPSSACSSKPVPFSALSSFKAVIFDLDGVIVDSEKVHPRTFELALAKYGVKIDSAHWKREYTGIGSYAIFEDLVKRYKIKEDARELVKKRNAIYLKEIRRNRLPVIAGFREVHRLLGESGVLEAVASGGHINHVEETLRLAGLRNVPFVAIEQVRKGKPAPELFLRAARRLRVRPSECIVFEDSLSGMEAAARAGMPCVALSTTMPKSELAGRAALIVGDFKSKKLKRLLAMLLAKRKDARAAGKKNAPGRMAGKGSARLRAPRGMKGK